MKYLSKTRSSYSFPKQNPDSLCTCQSDGRRDKLHLIPVSFEPAFLVAAFHGGEERAFHVVRDLFGLQVEFIRIEIGDTTLKIGYAFFNRTMHLVTRR